MPKAVLTDSQIQDLLKEPKPVTPDFRRWTSDLQILGNNLVGSRTVTTVAGVRFGIYLRKGLIAPNDFSLGLRLLIGPKKDVALVRCNGWHDEHKNHLERNTSEYIIPANTFHYHIATERYIKKKGSQKIGYAIPTQAFKCLDSALEFLIDNFGFVSNKTGEPFSLYTLIPWDRP